MPYDLFISKTINHRERRERTVISSHDAKRERIFLCFPNWIYSLRCCRVRRFLLIRIKSLAKCILGVFVWIMSCNDELKQKDLCAWFSEKNKRCIRTHTFKLLKKFYCTTHPHSDWWPHPSCTSNNERFFNFFYFLLWLESKSIK